MQYFELIDSKTEEEILKCYNKSKQTMESDVEAIKTWLNSQHHLPQILSDGQIMRYLFIGKGSVERTKPKIDMYFTIRSMFPDIFNDSHPLSDRMIRARRCVYALPLPKLCKNFNRIVLGKLKNVDDTELDLNACIAHSVNMMDIRLFEDMCYGDVVIVDLKNCKFGHVLKLTPILVRNSFIIANRALTTKLEAVHFINAPHFVDQSVVLIKSIVKPKLANRIFVHRDSNSLLESFSREIIPKDYGGNEKSLDELEDLLYKKYEEYKDFFDQRETRVNEDLRPIKNVNNEILGYYGNFKKLDVD